jgi:MFS family permease
MIAEFANYRSWIAWVPIVLLLAMPVLFRRVPVISLAMVGAFVGFVAISLTMPLGSYAEQLGANVALGLLGGAALGAILGAAVGRWRRLTPPLDASVKVVGYAVGFGLIGALVAGFAPSVLAWQPPDLDVAVILLVAVGGGLGWSIGAVIGWWSARSAPPPGRTQRWILGAAAAGIASLGADVVASIQQRSFGPSIDEMSRWDRQHLALTAALYCVDTAIVVLTLVAVAVRSSGPPATSQTSAEVPPLPAV